MIEVSCTISSSCKQSISLSTKEQRKASVLVRFLPVHKRLLLILRPGNCWLQKSYWSLVLWFLTALLSSVKRKKNHNNNSLALVLPGLYQVKHHCKSLAGRHSNKNHRNSRKLLMETGVTFMKFLPSNFPFTRCFLVPLEASVFPKWINRTNACLWLLWWLPDVLVTAR